MLARQSILVLTLVLLCSLSTNSYSSEKNNKPHIFTGKEMQTAAWLRDATRNDNLSYSILESLTTEVGPRMAGTPADARAVAWAEEKFKELGFDKVWKEPVRFPTWKRGIEKAEILSPYPQPLVITALGNSISTPSEGLTAELVEFATYKDLVAAPVDLIKGKIVFINHKMQVANDYSLVQAGRSRGASAAAKKGAVGMIIRSVGTDNHRLPHTGAMNYELGVEKIPAAAMSSSDADMVSRMLQRKRAVIVKLNLSSQNAEEYTSYNVIGEITGSEIPDEYVLIGGHLDSWDLGTGALDDGAGCAITMAAAANIKRHGLRPKRSIRVILFANEEQGLHGAKAYLAAHQNTLSKIQAGAEADYGQGPVIQFTSFVHPEAFPIVKQIHTILSPLGIEPGNNAANPGPDMGILKNAGMASFGLMLKGDDYFDFHHTADDTFDKVDLNRISQSTAAYSVFAWMAANSPVHFGSGSDILKPSKSGR